MDNNKSPKKSAVKRNIGKIPQNIEKTVENQQERDVPKIAEPPATVATASKPKKPVTSGKTSGAERKSDEANTSKLKSKAIPAVIGQKSVTSPSLAENKKDNTKKSEATSKQTKSEAKPSKSNKQSSVNAVLKPAKKEKSTLVGKEVLSTKSSAKSAIRKIIFQVRYTTQMGQSIGVCGNHALLGNNDVEKAFALTYINNEYWNGILEIPEGEEFSANVTYNYVLFNNDGTRTSDWGNDKVIDVAAYQAEELFFHDMWNDGSTIENTFFTEPFQEVLLKDNFTEVKASSSQSKTTHHFKVKAPRLGKGQALFITGSAKNLGDWDVESPILLSSQMGEPWHSVQIDLSGADFPIAYKYGVYDVEKKQFVAYENGTNRVIYESAAPGRYTIVSDGFVDISFNVFKGAGVAIPVFSLRSEKSFGVGEFTDLKLLVDWSSRVGLKLVQLLPVNDTTATHTFLDSYPYAAISAFALHPLYLHLPGIVDPENQYLLEPLQSQKEILNSKSVVDYEAVMAAKMEFLVKLFPLQKQKTFASIDFSAFFNENAHWLVPYAAFSYFREKYKTSDFSLWPLNNQYNEQVIFQLAGNPIKAIEEISIYFFIQYHLHLQLKEANNYAHAFNIILKGDIPIGIYRNSCDAWQQPELYNMDQQAGAPPDDFAIKGQNWGFPTYNWQKMKEDGFGWWKKRFKQMSYYFDAFRIDHILGFFRIWSIPLNAVEGILGHFVPAIPVHIHEFHSRGIYFDYNRLCTPYITENVLYTIFGNETAEVKAQYLNWQYDDFYVLKPEYDTQRKIESQFSLRTKDDHNNRIQYGLYNLISNVVLLEETGSNGQQFHFRISMESTLSFQALDSYLQQQLKELYLDYFFKRQDDFWRKEAMQKLPELKRSTNMLICGEDLGMVPASVPGVMHDLAILSLEIQRMPKDPKREFFHPNDAPYLSVVTPSTHDMSTIRGWWEEDREATQRFYNNELGQWGTAPYFCEPWIQKIILMQHFYSPAMWSIFQLQDLLGMNATLRRNNPNEERINIPSDPKHYWRYRMHLTLEELLNQDEFNNDVKTLVKQSGR